MISKELIFSGYIKNEDGELMDLFIAAAKHHFPNLEIFTSNGYDWPYYAVDSNYASGRNQRYVQGQKLKELTLDDFKPKPKTKVTYELVTDKTPSEIAKVMIDGDVFYSWDGSYSYTWDGKGFFDNHECSINLVGQFYRKVEKEVDWHAEAIEFVDKSNCICLDDTINFMLTKPNGETIDEYDNEVLELCRVILRANGELK